MQKVLVAAYLVCFEMISSGEWSSCFSMGRDWILSEQTFGTFLLFHKDTEWEVAPVGRWMVFIDTGMWRGKISTGSSAGGAARWEGGGGGRTLLLLFVSWVSAVVNNTLGFAFTAAGSFFLTGPWCFGNKRLEGCLILEPSISRLTPTYCGTSTAV